MQGLRRSPLIDAVCEILITFWLIQVRRQYHELIDNLMIPRMLPNLEEPGVRLPVTLLTAVGSVANTQGCSLERALANIIQAGLNSLQGAGSITTPDERNQLSARQQAVLEGIRRGRAIKEIGAELGVSEATVRTHVHRIRDRLGHADLLSLRIPRS